MKFTLVLNNENTRRADLTSALKQAINALEKTELWEAQGTVPSVISNDVELPFTWIVE